MSKTYKIDVTKNVDLQFESAIQDIVMRNVSAKIREKVARAVDRDLGNVFQRLAGWLSTREDTYPITPPEISPYLNQPWKEYQTGYERKKIRQLEHARWFMHGKPHQPERRREATLVKEFKTIDMNDVLNVVGNTRAILRRDKSGITLKMMPDVRFSTNSFEAYFEGDYLSEIAMHKLENRKKRYRALVGPAFAYFLDQRIPEVVRDALRKL